MESSSNPTKRARATSSPVENVDNKRARSSTSDTDIYDDNTATSVATTVSSAAAATSNPSASSRAIDIDHLLMDPSATLSPGFRPVWADTRQDLCECGRFFKSHQSGMYSKDKIPIGLLLDGYTEPRDFLGFNDLVVSCGGSREQYNVKDKRDGEKVPEGSHTTRSDKKPAGVNYCEGAIGLAVSVIIGSKHPQFKDLELGTLVPHDARYVELGAFRIIDVWKEYVQPEGVHTPYPVWRMKLHPVYRGFRPWYWSEHQEMAATALPQTLEPCLRNDCNTCGQSSPKIFENAPWVCLQEQCEQFFKTNGKLLEQIGDDGNELRYCQSFLNMAEPFHGTMKDLQEDIPQMFQPLPKFLDENGTLWGTEKELRGGFVCPDCGCANSQVFWGRRECRNCPFRQDTMPLPYPMDRVSKETDDDIKKHQKRHGLVDGMTIKKVSPVVDQFHITLDNGTRIIVNVIKNSEGKVAGTTVHERPDDGSRKAPCGADKMFEMIQAEAARVPYRRNPARCPDTSSQTLTRHFQCNYGVDYEFGVKPNPSEPFKDCPDVVFMSLALLTDAGKRALHYSQAIIKKYGYELVEGSTLMEPYKPYNELLALAYRETDSISWHDDGEKQVKGIISTASLGSPGTMGIRLKKNGKKGKAILEMHVCHGDVVTMCDTRLQAFAEHKVESQGVRRFAVTGRAIDIDYYKDPQLASKLSKMGTSIEQLEANGRLPERARHFSYGDTKLGDTMGNTMGDIVGDVVPDAQEAGSGCVLESDTKVDS